MPTSDTVAANVIRIVVWRVLTPHAPGLPASGPANRCGVSLPDLELGHLDTSRISHRPAGTETSDGTRPQAFAVRCPRHRAEFLIFTPQYEHFGAVTMNRPSAYRRGKHHTNSRTTRAWCRPGATSDHRFGGTRGASAIRPSREVRPVRRAPRLRVDGSE